MRLCEATLKKEKVETKTGDSKRPNILHRRVEVPELKSSVRLKLSTEGVELIKSAGGLVKFLEQRADEKLSKKLRILKQKLRAQGIIKVPEPEKAEEAAPSEAAATEAEAPETETAETETAETETAETETAETETEDKPTEETAKEEEGKPES